MRRVVVLLASLPIAALGVLIAHQASYLAVAGDGHGALLATTGHGYLDHAPLGLGALAALAVLSLAIDGFRARGRRSPTPPAAWHFGVIGPLAFAVQEHLERYLHDGQIPWTASLEATFILGIVLQLPAALLAFAVARRLIGAVWRVAGAIARRLADYLPHAAGNIRAAAIPAAPRRVHGPALLAVGAGRAPPITTPC